MGDDAIQTADGETDADVDDDELSDDIDVDDDELSDDVDTDDEVEVEVSDDSDPDEDFDDEDFDDATCAERVLESCLRAIVDRPEDIDIGVDEHDRRLTLHVRVATEDMGKIIGKRGRVANALRTLIKAAGSREGYSATVEIDD